MNIGSSGLREKIASVIGKGVETVLPVEGGYTNALRGIVRFEDGDTAFVKCATDARTRDWLLAQISVYRQITGDFMRDRESCSTLSNEDCT